ncbi:MAG TPA: NAD-dependent epimerase/dehydratase family protein [Candidatus Polarisedimenticolia bacterium]|nr:NAD-dependent epimerase/dehydratase family protein [Candidatus Polarisedimenticolia bacterium]
MGTILVTGGAGFIGSHLVERLLARGDHVVALDNFDPYYDPAIKRRNLEQALASRGGGECRFVEADIRDAKAMQLVFEAETPAAVVHLAARAGVRPSIEDPLLYEEVNVRGTAVLLEACRRHGVNRFLFGSSSSVYGDSTEVPFSEDARVDRPVSPYAATKVAGELLCSTYHHLFGLNVFALRFFTVYGPRQRPEMAIHKFARLILEGKPLPRFGDGRTERDYTYIDDILDGVVKALDKVSGYGVYNLGESRRVSLTALIGLLEKALGRRALVEPMPEQPGDVKMTCADIRRARADLGYNPRVPIEEGIVRFAAWLTRKGAAA